MKNTVKLNDTLEVREIVCTICNVKSNFEPVGSDEVRFCLVVNTDVGIMGKYGTITKKYIGKSGAKCWQTNLRYMVLNPELSLKFFANEIKYSDLVGQKVLVRVTLSPDETLYDNEIDKPWMSVSNIEVINCAKVVSKEIFFNEDKTISHTTKKVPSVSKKEPAVCSLTDLLD